MSPRQHEVVRLAPRTVSEAHSRIDTHEAVCEQRWTETINRIKRLETIIIASTGFIIVLLIGIVLKIKVGI